MPIYEYACKACGAALEIRQKFSDAALTDCPACGAPALERLVSASSFSLKGSGWYADGYTGERKKAEASSDSGDTGTKDAKDKTDTSSTKTSEKKTSDTPKTEAKKAS